MSACGKKGPPTLRAYEKPQRPSGLTAIHREDRIVLAWSYPGDLRSAIKGFQVLMSEGEGFGRKEFVDSDQSSFVDDSFKVDIAYKYKVVAQSFKDVLSADSDIISVTPKPLPSPPEEIRFALKSDAVELSWKGSGEDVCYNIYKSLEKGKYSDIPLNREPDCMTIFKDSSLMPAQTVYYTIRALHNTPLKDEGFPSGESVLKPSDFVPSAPSELSALRTDQKTYLVWKESPESWTKGYRVYRKREGEEGFTMIGEAKAPAFTDSQKSEIKTWYMIKALGPSAESEPVNIEVP